MDLLGRLDPRAPVRVAPAAVPVRDVRRARRHQVRRYAALREAIADAELDHRRADLESLLRPAIQLVLKPVRSPPKGVTTRFGGPPDLPASFVWPRNGKLPLAFVAQLRVDDLAACDHERRLPRRGVLSLFVQLPLGDGYAEEARVFHFPDPRALVRTGPPPVRTVPPGSRWPRRGSG